MNVLLALDYHAIAMSRGGSFTDKKSILRWMISLVDSDLIQIWYRDTATYKCSLLDLPNWAYSYALALFQLHKSFEFALVDDDVDPADIKRRANAAIQQAMSRFPSVVGHLLHGLEVDTTGRSFQRDWVTVLDVATARSRELVRDWHTASKDTVVLSATLQTCDLVTKIFVQQNAKLWGDDEVLQFMYENLKELQSLDGADIPLPPCPAIMRYAGADPADYDNKIQTLPPDANIINPGLVARAMIVNPNLPRLLRNQMQQQRGGGRGFDENHDRGDVMVDANGNRMIQRHFFGPPTQIVDPDWPMVEVFWRSFLPWNHVEGIPPPRR